MASIFLKDPVYITTREVIDSTTKTAMIPFVNVTGESLQTDAIIWDKIFLEQKNFDDTVVSNIVIKTAGTSIEEWIDYDVFVDDGTFLHPGQTYIEIITIQTGAITADYTCIPSDDSLKILIVRSQQVIDDYIERTFRERYSDTQRTMFPVDRNNSSRLPEEVKEACLYVVEQLYVNGDMVSATTTGVKSESMGPRSITYFDDTSKKVVVPSFVSTMLDKFKNLYFRQVI